MTLDTNLKKDLLKILGIRGNIHGALYQLNLIALAAIRAHNNQQKFCLTSDAEEFGKFDDVVIDYGDLIIFLQAKHSEQSEENNSYKESDLCADPNSHNNAISLAKYFDSWHELYKSKYTQNEGGIRKRTQFIFLTNKQIEGFENFLEEFVLESDKFSFKNTKTLKFKTSEAARKKFIDAIKVGSKYITDSEPTINFGSASEELKKKLAEYVLEKYKKEEITISTIRNTNDDIKPLLIEIASKEESLELLVNWITSNKPKGAKKFFDSQFFRIYCKNKIIYTKTIPASDVQSLVDQFLNELIIKANQPNEDKLFKIIKKELDSSQNFASSEIFYQFYADILKWLKNKNNSILDNTELTNEIENIINDLKRFYLLGGTLIYKKESEKLSDTFTQIPEIQGLKEWLLAFDNHVLLLSDAQENSAIEKRIYQTIKQQNYEDSKWHFITLNSEYFEYLEGSLDGESTQLAIIDCRHHIFTEQILEKISDIKNVAITKNKKLIFILKQNQIEKLDVSEVTKLDIELLSHQELVQLSQNYQEKYVSIGGRSIQIGSLLIDQITGIYNTMMELGNLYEMILSSQTKHKIDTYYLPYDIYIENGLSEGEPIYKDLGEFIQKVDARLFIAVIQNDNDRDYRDKKRDFIKNLEAYFNTEEDKSRFSSAFQEGSTRYLLIGSLTNQDEHQCKRIYFSSIMIEGFEDACHLKHQENMFTIIKSPLEAGLPIASEYNFKLIPDLRNSILSDEKSFSILSSIAGYGKSSFCYNVMNKWLVGEISSFSWIFMISLPQIKSIELNKNIEILDILDKSTLTSWQRYAVDYDLRHNPSTIMFLLDSLDEVKKNNIVNFLNEWLVIIPGKTKVFITTRPYAAHKIIIPQSKALGHYLTLEEYDDNQRKDYINQYLDGIAKEQTIENFKQKTGNIEKGISMYIENRPKKSTIDLLGVPLECYIICEALKPQIIEHLNSAEEKEFIVAHDDLGIVSLYQLFTLNKLRDFLIKHMKITPENSLIPEYRVYSFTISYANMLMIFAFRQAFSLEYNLITEMSYRTYYTEEMIEDLKTTGLVTIHKQKEGYYLRFDHETYQEYFAALFILKSFLSIDDKVYNIAENIIKLNCYDPAYRVIMMILAQLTLLGDPLIPGWNKKNPDHVNVFWKIISQAGDILGAGAKDLINDCIRELTIKQKESLACFVKEESWSRLLLESISNFQEIEDNVSEGVLHDNAPVLQIPQIHLHNNQEVDVEFLKDQLNSRLVVTATRKLLQIKEPSEVAKLLYGAANDKLGYAEYKFWAPDGGFAAISYLGNAFNEDLANYFIDELKTEGSGWNGEKRIFWNTGHFSSALNAIANLFKPQLDEYPQQMCTKVILFFLEYKNNEKLSDDLARFIKNIPSALLLENLKVKLYQEIDLKYDYSSLSSILKDNKQLIIFPAEVLINIFWCSSKLKFAVVSNEEDSSFSLIGNKRIKIVFNDHLIDDLFIEFIKTMIVQPILDAQNKEKIWKEFLNLSNKIEDNALDKKLGPIAKTIAENDEYFQKFINDKDRVSFLYGLMKDYHLLTQDMVDKLKAKCLNYNNWWPLDGGIEAVSTVGAFFNDVLAEFLLSRSGMRYDNKKVIDSLKILYQDIKESCNMGAILAYNKCCTLSNDLVQIDIPNNNQNTQLFYLSSVRYDNPILNNNYIMFRTFKMYGAKGHVQLLELGKDQDLGNSIIEAVKEFGLTYVLDLLFGSIRKTDLSSIIEEHHSLITISAEAESNILSSFDFIRRIEIFDNLNWQLQKLLNFRNLWKFESIKAKYGIAASFDVFRESNSNFKKSVLLKLHPDKNLGNQNCNNDFVFVTNLREELNKPFNIQKLLDEKIQTIQQFIYKSNIGFKVLDTGADLARLIYMPTIDNTKKVLIDTTHLYSIYSGFSVYSSIINGYDILYKAYKGEFFQAVTQAATTMGYMLLPTMINYVAIPYVGFAYTAGLAIYGGYNSIANVYSLYNEFNQKDFTLNSNIAYQSLAETLSTTPLQKFYDFSSKAKEYEKAAYKIKLEEKGEFGQKLYDYIYALIIEEKYDLLNKVTQGTLTEEESNVLKAKHIQVMNYDHCMEVIEPKEEQSDHYYCYNEEQQILDHIVIIGNSYVEKISSL